MHDGIGHMTPPRADPHWADTTPWAETTLGRHPLDKGRLGVQGPLSGGLPDRLPRERHPHVRLRASGMHPTGMLSC